MSPEHIFKLRRKYLHECRKLQKEAERLNEFYPTNVRSDNRKPTGTKTEPVKNMPVTKKESAMDEFSPESVFGN